MPDIFDIVAAEPAGDIFDQVAGGVIAPALPPVPDMRIPAWDEVREELPDSLLKNEKAIKNSLSIAATHDISPDQALDLRETYEEEVNESSLYEKAQGSFKAGIGDVYSTAGNTMKWLGASDEFTRTYTDFGERLRSAYLPPTDESEFTWRKMGDPEWWATTGARSVPFVLSLIPAAIVGAYGGAVVGTGAAAITGLGTFGTTVLTTIGGASGAALMSRPVESAFEAGGVFEEAKARGMTDEEADAAADNTFWGNMTLTGIDAAQFALAFTPLKIMGPSANASLARRILATVGKVGVVGLGEAGEERIQEVISAKALGDEVDFFDVNDPRLNEASAVGMIFGVGLGGSGSVYTALTDRVVNSMPDDVKTDFETNKAAAVTDGLTDEAAELKALDAISATPEGKAHVEDVLNNLKEGVDIGKPVEAAPVEEAAAPEAPTAEEDIAAADAAIDLVIEGTEFDTLTDEEIAVAIGAVEAPVTPAEAEAIPEAVPEAKPPVHGLVSVERRESLVAEFLASQEVEAETDKLLDRLRSGVRPTQRKARGKSLVEFMRDIPEGIEDVGGELVAMDIDKAKKPFERNVVREGGIDPDQAVQRAHEAGFFPGIRLSDITPNDLFVATQRELAGDPQFSIQQGDEALQAELANLEDLERVLDEIDVGLEMSNEEIKAVMRGADPATVRKGTGAVRGIKGQIAEAVGIKKVSRMIREDKALAAAWKKAEQSARTAFREGNKEGVATERDRLKEIFAEARSRVEATTKVGKLKARILKEIKTTKAKKRGGKPVGKFTADVQRILDRFREAVKLSQEQAIDKIADNLDKFVGSEMPDSVILENRVLDMIVRLRYRAGEPGAPPLRRRFTVGELETLLEGIKEMKVGGKAIAELKKLNRKARDQKRVDDAVSVIMGGKELPKGLETTGVRPSTIAPKDFKEWLKKFTSSAGIHFVGWNDLMDMLSARDKTSEPGQSKLNQMAEVHTQENIEKGNRTKAVQEIARITRAAFGFTSDREMLTQFNLDAKEIEIGQFPNAKGTIVDLVMTKAEARKFMMEYSDPALRETFHEGMNFTDDMIQAIRGVLTAQDLTFIENQLEFYRQYYDRVNAVYREAYGVDLPFNEFYSPIRREGFVEPQGLYGAFLDEISYRRSVGSGSLKSRVKNLRRISLQSDVNVLERHIAEMEHFIAWSEKVRELNTVFKNPQVRTAVNLHHSKNMLGVIDKFINDFTRGGIETSNRLNWLDKIRGNFTRSVLAVKPTMTIKQLTSVMAYMEVMPVTDFVKGVANFWSAPLEKVKFLKKNSVWFAERGTFMERDVKTAMRMKEFSAYRKTRGFMDSLMLNVALGDQGAIAIGGWSYFQYLMKKKGLSQKAALTEFERFSEMTQQSADLSIQSDIQRMGSIAKLFSMFLSAPNLYVRKEMGAVRNLLAGRGSPLGHAKTLFIYHVLLPSLFQFVTDAFNWDEDNQKRAVILGPLNGLFIIGEGLELLVSKALGVRAFGNEVAPYAGAKDFGKFLTEAIRLISEGDLTDEEFYRGTRGLAGGIGAVTGLPTKQAVDLVKSGSDFVDGEYEKGFKEFIGYSPFVVEQHDKTIKGQVGAR